MSARTLIRDVRLSTSARDASHTVRNSLLGVVFGFGGGVLSAHLLGPHDRGTLALLVTTVGITGFLASLGSNVALRVGLLRDPRIQLRPYVELSLLLSGVQAVLVVAAVVLLGSLIDLDQHRRLGLVAAAVGLGLTYFASQQVLDSLNAIGWPSGSAMLNSVGTLVTCLLLLVAWWLRQGLYAAVGAYAGGFVVVVVLGVLLHRTHAAAVPVPDPQLASRSVFVRRGLPMLGLNLSQALAFRLDRYFVGASAGAAATGMYAVAAAHVAPSQVASNSIGQVASRDAARDDLPDRRLAAMALAATLLAAAAAVVLWLLSPWFVPTVFGREFAASVPLVRVLMLGQVVLAPYLVLCRAFTGRGLGLVSSASGVLLLVLLTVALAVLTPGYGALGAAWATVLAFGLSSLALALLTRFPVARPRPPAMSAHPSRELTPPRSWSTTGPDQSPRKDP
ncbi:lipopolysaccharide biosynthesis protein [uncultured Friedmanniella sp.]|uniref:lipopolysaccharide biosynthesis protein n=1 Tax=uncultured Friedmanniella sp. TaxID=335381 RepID=UPI0035CA2B20